MEDRERHLTSHDEKRLRRIGRELHTWRAGIVRSFHRVNNTMFSEEQARKIRALVEKDKALLGHIDPLIRAINELTGFSEVLPPVPKVEVKIGEMEKTTLKLTIK